MPETACCAHRRRPVAVVFHLLPGRRIGAQRAGGRSNPCSYTPQTAGCAWHRRWSESKGYDFVIIDTRNAADTLIESAALAADIYASPVPPEITEYINTSYPEWITRCEKILRQIHAVLQNATDPIIFSFSSVNAGTRPGKDVIVTITAKGNFLIRPPQVEHESESDSENHDSAQFIIHIAPLFQPHHTLLDEHFRVEESRTWIKAIEETQDHFASPLNSFSSSFSAQSRALINLGLPLTGIIFLTGFERFSAWTRHSSAPRTS